MSETIDGKAIKSLIKKRKLKVKDVAEAIGLTPNTSSSALNGNRVLGKGARISLFRELNLKPESLLKKAS